MKKKHPPQQIASAVSNSRYSHMLESLPFTPCLISYDTGDYLITPHDSDRLLFIIVEGAVSIYYIRDDGSLFSLATLRKDAIVGESYLFDLEAQNVYVEAIEPVKCIAIDIRKNKEQLMNNAAFLRVIAEIQATKISTITMQDAHPLSLRERVLSYMRYACQNGRLKGIENAAFHMHCSSRQLQRILNEYEQAGIVRKVKKGTYELI